MLALRPILISRVSNGAKAVSVPMVVGTGADNCLFPLSFLKILGLDPLNLEMRQTGGIGNSANETFFSLVKIDVGVGAPFTTFAGFTAGIESFGVGLLGQSGFFENYRATFNHSGRVFHVDV